MVISSLVNDALIEAGILTPTDEANADDHAFAVRTLNRILDFYDTQELIVGYREETIITSDEIGGSGHIVFGSGQVINHAAPAEIVSMFWRQDNTDYPMAEMTRQQYDAIPVKGSAGIPRYYAYQYKPPDMAELFFNYRPVTGMNLHVVGRMPMHTGSGVQPTDDVTFARGVEKALVSRLALELCPSYEITPNQMLVAKAGEAEDWLKTYNNKPLTMSSDPVLSKRKKRTNYNPARF